jgi:hypothetical protein
MLADVVQPPGKRERKSLFVYRCQQGHAWWDTRSNPCPHASGADHGSITVDLSIPASAAGTYRPGTDYVDS